MTAEQMDQQLRAALRDAGFQADHASPRLAWECFKGVCATGVNSGPDGLLFQWGTYTFTGPRQFHFSLVRQFVQANSNEFLQLELLLTREPDATSDQLADGNLWSFDFSNPAEFFRQVERMPDFRACLALAGWRATISIDET